MNANFQFEDISLASSDIFFFINPALILSKNIFVKMKVLNLIWSVKKIFILILICFTNFECQKSGMDLKWVTNCNFKALGVHNKPTSLFAGTLNP